MSTNTNDTPRDLAGRGLEGKTMEMLQATKNDPAPLAVDLETAGRMLGGVSAATVKREIYRGHLHGLKVGRQWRVRVAELHAYLRRQETTA